jgi:L-lactate dehydrogenase complex protein LldG
MDGGEVNQAALLETRLQEVGSRLRRARGPETLARILAQEAGEPLWLEDHPWLREAGPELEKHGLTPHFAEESWELEAHTAVTVGLGAIPETGSVLVAGNGPASWLPLQARLHVVLVPAPRADLTLAQALELTEKVGSPLVTWLTGPTRTADIEKVLILGAQGPGELVVVLYDSEQFVDS